MVMGWLIQVLITQARTSAQSPVDIAIVQERNPVLCLRKYFGIPLKTPSLKVLVLALMIMADYMSRGSATGQTFTSVKPSSPSNVRAQPFSQSWRGVLAFSKFFGGRKLKFNKMLPRPQNAVFSPLWVQVPSRVKVYQSVMAPSRGYQPIFHNPHPSRYCPVQKQLPERKVCPKQNQIHSGLSSQWHGRCRTACTELISRTVWHGSTLKDMLVLISNKTWKMLTIEMVVQDIKTKCLMFEIL